MRLYSDGNSHTNHKVSIHASVKDATCNCLPARACNRSFNPRICKRCDVWQAALDGKVDVSIHASVKDATKLNPGDTGKAPVSIHASVKDATPCNGKFGGDDIVSIHASVKDATLLHSSPSKRNSCFNPRICKRCDRRGKRFVSRLFVSIHASVKDATAIGDIIIYFKSVSIHASVKDATR